MKDSSQLEFRIDHLNELPNVAKQFLEIIQPKAIIAFDAPMGTGKTTFIVSLLKQLGIDHPEGSPTYSLVHRYDSEKWGVIYHLDLYRLSSLSEAYDIGIEEICSDYDFCFIEWPEKVASILPEECKWTYLRTLDHGRRTLTIAI